MQCFEGTTLNADTYMLQMCRPLPLPPHKHAQKFSTKHSNPVEDCEEIGRIKKNQFVCSLRHEAIEHHLLSQVDLT